MQSAPAAIAVSGNHNVARSRGKANAPSRTARGVRMTPKERAQLAAVQQWEQTGTAEALVSQGGEVCGGFMAIAAQRLAAHHCMYVLLN